MTEDPGSIDALDRLFREKPLVLVEGDRSGMVFDLTVGAAALTQLGLLVAPPPMVPPFRVYDFDDEPNFRDSFFSILDTFSMMRCRRRVKRDNRIVANETLFGDKVPRPSRGWRKHQRKAKGRRK